MKMLTTKVAAEILDEKPRKIRYLIESGQLRAIKVGPKIYCIREEDLAAFEAVRKLSPSPDHRRKDRSSQVGQPAAKRQILEVLWTAAASDEDAMRMQAILEGICDLASFSARFSFCKRAIQIKDSHFLPLKKENIT